jgi:hypothetical protein
VTEEPSPDAAASSSGDWQARLARIARMRQPPQRVRGALLVGAGIAVAVGVVLSIRALDIGWADLRLAPLLAALLLITPATILLNGAELKVMATIVGRGDQRLGWRASLRATVVATAANLLPIPGGALVRIAAVRSVGVRTTSATAINLVGAGAWVAAGLLIAAVAGLTVAPWGAVGVAAGLGIAGVIVVLGMIHRLSDEGATWWSTGALFLVEGATAVVHGLRLWLVLLALGVEVSIRQGLALGAGAPLAAAAGVFPSGLGLAEALTAVIAPIVALPAAAGFAATALGRVVGLLGTAPLALAFGVEDLRRRAREFEEQAEASEPEEPDRP